MCFMCVCVWGGTKKELTWKGISLTNGKWGKENGLDVHPHPRSAFPEGGNSCWTTVSGGDTVKASVPHQSPLGGGRGAGEASVGPLPYSFTLPSLPTLEWGHCCWILRKSRMGRANIPQYSQSQRAAMETITVFYWCCDNRLNWCHSFAAQASSAIFWAEVSLITKLMCVILVSWKILLHQQIRINTKLFYIHVCRVIICWGKGTRALSLPQTQLSQKASDANAGFDMQISFGRHNLLFLHKSYCKIAGLCRFLLIKCSHLKWDAGDKLRVGGSDPLATQQYQFQMTWETDSMHRYPTAWAADPTTVTLAHYTWVVVRA